MFFKRYLLDFGVVVWAPKHHEQTLEDGCFVFERPLEVGKV
jgi:hypothetical protein